MQERRKHRRLSVIKDLTEQIELAITDPQSQKTQHYPGVLTNLSAGGMHLVMLGAIEGNQAIKLAMQLPGIERFEVEGKIVWSRLKGATSIIGIQFTKIDAAHAKQLTQMAEAFWENENRDQKKTPHRPVSSRG